jgi:hypothetical protein
MQASRKESPPGAVPQNGGAPLSTTAGKSECRPSEPNLPRRRVPSFRLMHMGARGRRQLMEAAHLATKLDPGITPLVEDWDRMKPPLQNAVDLGALLEAHGVDESHLFSVVGEAELRFHGDPSTLIGLLNQLSSFIDSADARTE